MIIGSEERKLVIGFLTPMGGSWAIGPTSNGAVPVAIEKANRYPELQGEGGYRLDFVWRDSGCDAGKALAGMADLLELGVDVVIGPACSIACEPVQLLASSQELLQVVC